jgi:hypothetical protein
MTPVPNFAIEASPSWRFNLRFATLIAPSMRARPVTAVGRGITRESHLIGGES